MKKIWALVQGDWLNLWRSSKVIFGMILLYEVIYLLAGEEWIFLSVLSVALGGMLSYSSLGYDERSGWNRFILTTAYSRKDYVLGKYLVALMGTIGGGVVLALVGLIADLTGKVPLESGLVLMAGPMACGTLISLSIVLPLAFYFGIEKARLLNMLVIFLIFAGAGGMAGVGGSAMEEFPSLITGLNFILPVVTVCLLLLSSFLSVRIYQKRQF